jgi:hypothetical protein
VETKVRIPTGDAIQRVYSVADAGGLTIIEVINESTLPIAVALTGGSLLTRRPSTSMPAQGIDLPPDAVILPIGHSSSIIVARAHSGASVLPDSLPSSDQVVRGWLAQTQRASRLQLPDVAMVDAVTAARCELLLDGPAGGDDLDSVDQRSKGSALVESASVDPATFLLAVGELVRLGDAASIWVPDIVTVLERCARRGTQIAHGGVEAAARVLHSAGEHKAVGDLRRMNLAAPIDPPTDPIPTEPGLVPAWVEHLLVISDERVARLMPASFPAPWLGIDFEAHGLAIGLASTLSFAIRWHGERPAVLWEISGAPMPLTYGDWTTGQLSGEALWPPLESTRPPSPSTLPIDGPSFS